MNRTKLLILLVAFGVALDQASKLIIFNYVPLGQEHPLLNEILHLRPSLNPGVAFSLLRDRPMLVLAISVIAVPLIGWWVLHGRTKVRPLMLIAQSLILTGALGNLIDRLVPPHSVRDFIDFRPEIPVIGRWAIFNVADACICIGVALFILMEICAPQKEEKAKLE